MPEANGGCQKSSGTLWWSPEPSNTTIFTNTPKIWLGLRMLPELTGGRRRRVVGARGEHRRRVREESGECWSQSGGHQSRVVVVRGEGWMPEARGRHWKKAWSCQTQQCSLPLPNFLQLSVECRRWWMLESNGGCRRRVACKGCQWWSSELIEGRRSRQRQHFPLPHHEHGSVSACYWS